MRLSLGKAAFAALLITSAVRAGTLSLVNGDSLSGALKRGDGGWNITLDDGSVRWVSDREVKAIELSSKSATPNRAAEGLRSLQRSVEFSDDLPRIIQRYRTFIEQTKDPATLQAAKAELAIWQSRLDRHLVKVGKQWMTPDERTVLVRKWRQNAEQARLLMKDSRDREAAKLINQTLEEDPQNASALYLRGVLADKRLDFQESKKAYQAVQQALPLHAPTLFNLSLVLAKQNQWPASCVSMEQALTAAPITQVLLDSAAELLNLVPQESRRTPAAQKLLRTFLDQDAKLQKTMQSRKLYRWGATWINEDDHAQIQKQSDEVQKKIAEIQKKFDVVQDRLKSIDTRLRDNELSMRDMEQRSTYRMPDGSLVRVPLPRQYYTMQSENVELKAQRIEEEAKVEPLRAEARETQQKMPQPTYTGTILPINEDGVPLPDVGQDPSAPVSPDGVSPNGPTVPPPPASQPSTIIQIGPSN